MRSFPPAKLLRESAVDAGQSGPQGAMMQSIMSSMATAINTGLLTCTASVAGKLQPDVQAVLRELVNNGYGVSISGTTLTVTW